MANEIEDAVERHIREQSRASLGELYQAILAGRLLVPVFADLTADSRGRTDVPARCIRLPTGEGCLLVFTSVERLLEWQPHGSKYAEIPSHSILLMATAMPEIDCIYVNYSERKGTPKGRLSREEFELLGRDILPVGDKGRK